MILALDLFAYTCYNSAGSRQILLGFLSLNSCLKLRGRAAKEGAFSQKRIPLQNSSAGGCAASWKRWRVRPYWGIGSRSLGFLWKFPFQKIQEIFLILFCATSLVLSFGFVLH
jgi:hypothetical protein